MIHKKNSDITKVDSGIIAHGVNCQGVMGSGVAKALYTKYPIVKSAYLKMYKHSLGNVQIVEVDKGLDVFNCHTQEFYGYNDSVYASLSAVVSTLTFIAGIAKQKDVNIPKIGCGLGGLNWDDVESELLCIEKIYDVEFVVHTL